MKPEATINSANSTIFSRLLGMQLPCQAPTHTGVPGTMFPLVSKGGAEGAGAIRNHLSFSAVMSFRQAPASDGERKGAGLSLQECTVYNLILLI